LMSRKPLYLNLARRDHTLADAVAILHLAVSGHFIKGDGHHFNVEVYAIKQRPADFAEVSLHRSRAAQASLLRTVIVTTRTWIHAGNEHEVRRVLDGNLGAGDGHPSLFHRLTHDLQYRTLELRKLVEKEYAIVCKRNFAGLRIAAAPHKRNIGYG